FRSSPHLPLAYVLGSDVTRNPFDFRYSIGLVIGVVFLIGFESDKFALVRFLWLFQRLNILAYTAILLISSPNVFFLTFCLRLFLRHRIVSLSFKLRIKKTPQRVVKMSA